MLGAPQGGVGNGHGSVPRQVAERACGVSQTLNQSQALARIGEKGDATRVVSKVQVPCLMGWSYAASLQDDFIRIRSGHPRQAQLVARSSQPDEVRLGRVAPPHLLVVQTFLLVVLSVLDLKVEEPVQLGLEGDAETQLWLNGQTHVSRRAPDVLQVHTPHHREGESDHSELHDGPHILCVVVTGWFPFLAGSFFANGHKDTMTYSPPDSSIVTAITPSMLLGLAS